MSDFVEVKTEELVGPALDWAVAKSCGYECGRLPRIGNTFGCNLPNGLQYVIGRLCGASIAEELNARFFRPSTDWAQGGPLLDKYDISLNGGFADGDWDRRVIYATLRDGNHGDYGQLALATGPTRLISACRAVVRYKLGDIVPVPKELTND